MIDDKVYCNFLSSLLAGDRKSCVSITEKVISENIAVKEI